MLLFMGCVSADDISKEEIENRINLEQKIKIRLILSSLLASNVKILSDPYIPMDKVDNFVSLYVK